MLSEGRKRERAGGRKVLPWSQTLKTSKIGISPHSSSCCTSLLLSVKPDSSYRQAPRNFRLIPAKPERDRPSSPSVVPPSGTEEAGASSTVMVSDAERYSGV